MFTSRFSSKASSNKVDAMHQVDAASLAKAHKLSVPVGVLAGVFGSFVGVGGGVLIVPLLTGACKALPQRYQSCRLCFLCSFCLQFKAYIDCHVGPPRSTAHNSSQQVSMPGLRCLFDCCNAMLL